MKICLVVLLMVLAMLLGACGGVTPYPTSVGVQTTAVAPVPSPSTSITEVGTLGQGSANDIAWTADGKLLVAGSSGLTFYDGASGKLLQQLGITTDHPYEFPSDISISPDGRQMAFVGLGGLWKTDVESGKTINLLHDMLGLGNQVIYSQDQQKLAFLRYTVSADGFGQFWGLSILDANTGKTIADLIEQSPTKLYAIRLSPDGHVLAAASGDNLVYLFRMDTGEKLGVLRGHESDVLDLDFSPDGQYLASVSADATLRMWDVQAERLVQTVHGFTGGLHFVRFTPDGRYLLAQLPEGNFEEWAIDAHEMLSAEHPLIKLDQAVRQVALQPHGTLLAVLDGAGQVRVWDWSTGEQTQTFAQFGNDISRLAWSPDGKLIAAASGDCYTEQGIIDIWRTQDHQLFRQLETKGICDLRFGPDGNRLAAFDADGTITVWDVAAGYETNEFSTGAFSYNNMQLSFSPDGQEIVAAGRSFQLWTLNGQNSAWQVDLPHNPMAISFSPDGKMVALAMEYGIEVRDARTGSQLANWKPEEGDIRSAGFQWKPTGAIAVLSGYPMGGFAFHDLLTGRLLYQISSAANYGFTMSPDGRLLVPFGSEPEILDTSSGAVLWNAKEQIWNKVAFSSDGNYLATADYGNAVHLWNVGGLAQSARQAPMQTATANPALEATVTPSPTQPRPLDIARSTPPTPQPAAIQPGNISQLAQFARFGKGALHLAAWSADGTTFAVSTSIGIYIYRVEPFGETGFIDASGDVIAMALSQAGDRLLTSDLKLWDTDSGKLLYQFQAPDGNRVDGGPYALQFDPGGNTVEAQYYVNTTCSWNLGQLAVVGCQSKQFTGRAFKPLAVSPNGHLAAFLGSPDTYSFKSAQIIDTSSGSVLLTLKAGNNVPDGVLFSPDGNTFAFISHEETRLYGGGVIVGSGRIELWSINADGTFRQRNTLEIGHAGLGTAPSTLANFVAFSPDGFRLYDANGDGALQVWDVASGRLLYSAPDAGRVFYMSPNGQYLLSSNGVDRIRLWKLDRTEAPVPVQSVAGFSEFGNFVAFSADSLHLISGSPPVAEWSNIFSPSVGNSGPDRIFGNLVSPLAASLQGNLLAGQVNDGMLQILDAGSGAVIRSIQAVGDNPQEGLHLGALAFSPDGQILASSGDVWSVRLWNTQDGQLLKEIKLGDDDAQPRHLVFSPDGRYLAGSGYESSDQNTVSHTTVEVWDVSTGQEIRFFDLVGSAIVFAPNGFQIISGRGDGKLFLLDLRSGQSVWTATVDGTVDAVAFSPDANLLAVNSHGTVHMLATSDWASLYTLPSISNANAVQFSPDGKILAVACNDGTVQLFRLR